MSGYTFVRYAFIINYRLWEGENNDLLLLFDGRVLIGKVYVRLVRILYYMILEVCFVAVRVGEY